MKRNRSIKAAFALALALLLCALSGAALADTAASGACGDSVTWTLSDTGLLTISGSGPMANYISSSVPWKSYTNSIKTVSIGSGVTSIGNYAFYGCSNLRSVSIPASVTTLGNGAFWSCSSLGGIILPEGLTTIGSSAFNSCSALDGVVIPASVTTLGGGAFYYCTALSEIDVPEGVTTINDLTFYNCDALTRVSLPESVTSLGRAAFQDCHTLEHIDLPSGVTSMGDSVFSCCLKLHDIRIPDGVTSIGSEAFVACEALEEVHLPSGLTSIGNSAFDGCSSIESAFVPSTVTSVGTNAFPKTTTLYCTWGSAIDSTLKKGGYTVAYEANVEVTNATGTVYSGITNFNQAASAFESGSVQSGSTIRLTQDIDLDAYVSFGDSTSSTPKAITLDLNGHALTNGALPVNPAIPDYVLLLSTNCVMTIMDSSAGQTGRIANVNDSQHAYSAVTVYGTLNVESGSLVGAAMDEAAAICAKGETGRVNISGTARIGDGASGRGIHTEGFNRIAISGGTVTGADYGIHSVNRAGLTVTGGTIEGSVYLNTAADGFNVSGGALSGGVSVYSGTGTDGISGGLFRGAIARTSDYGAAFITGGCFDTQPSADYVADGYLLSANPDAATQAEYPWAVVPAPTDDSGLWGSCAWRIAGGQLTIGAGTGANTAGVSPWQHHAGIITSVKFESGVNLPADASGLFEGFAALRRVDMAGLNTAAAQNLDRAFAGCEALFELDLSGWNTAALTSAADIFSGCTQLAVVKTGANLSFSGATASPLFDLGDMHIYLHDDWWSETDGCRYTAGEIAQGRSGVADTYSKMAPWTTTDGLWGSCVWKMTVENEVYVYEGTGASTVSQVSPWADYSSTITGLYMEDGVVLPACCDHLFSGLRAMRALEFGDIDTSAVTNISAIFYECSALERVDISEFDGVRPTEQVFGLFYGCTSLKEADISGLNLEATSNFANMFGNCQSLERVNVGNITTGPNGSLYYMFWNCRSLVHLDLSGFDTHNVASTTSMFQDCAALETLDLSGMNTDGVGDMKNMFQGCESLRQVKLGESFSFMGSGDAVLVNLPRGKWLSAKTGQSYYANQISETRGHIADTYTFQGDDGSAVGHWGTCDWELTKNGILTVHPGAGVEATGRVCPWADYSDNVKAIYFEDGVVMPENCEFLFTKLNAVRRIEFGEIDASQVRYIQGIFSECTSLESASLSAFAGLRMPAQVWGLFYECRALQEADISMLNFEDSTNFANMFGGCESLEDVTIGDISVGQASLWYMFYNCRALQHIDLSGFDTHNATDASYMFRDCVALETVDMSGMDTRNMGSMNGMFEGCENLRQVTLGENFTFMGNGSVPLGSLPKGKWLSANTGKSYYANQISEDRGCVADTYTFQGDDGGAAGHWGTCEWELTKNGILTVHPGEGVEAVNRICPWANYSDNVKSIYFEDGVVMPENCEYLFTKLSAARIIEFGEIDTSRVRYFQGIFSECSALERVDLSAFAGLCVPDQAWGIFYECRALKEADISMLNFEESRNFANLFGGCVSLERVNVGNLATAPNASLWYMFYNCRSLKHLDLSGIDTRNVADVSYMFRDCTALETVDLSGMDTRNMGSMNGMFEGCSNLRRVKLGENFTFYGNTDAILTNLPTGSWYSWAAGEYFTSDQISSYRSGVADTYTRDAEGDWGDCHWTLTGRTLTVNAGTGANTEGVSPWASLCGEIGSVDLRPGVVFPNDASRLFEGMSGLSAIDLSGVNTANTHNFSGMFAGMSGLTELDLTAFNTASATAMAEMFEGCRALHVVTLGTGFSFIGSGSAALGALPAGSWTSAADGATYTEAEIAAQRGFVADTYTRVPSLADAIVTLEPKSFTYSGEAQVPQIQVKLYGDVLSSEAYTVEYPENTIDAGDVTVTLRGVSPVGGEIQATYRIKPAPVREAVLALAGEAPIYTGEPLEPGLRITYGENILSTDDYTATYADNVNAGQATVSVTGRGNYSGHLDGTFEIMPKPIDGMRLTVTPSVLATGGEAVEPAVTLMDGDEPIADFEVSYSNNDLPGTGWANAYGTGNYTGSLSAGFTLLNRGSMKALKLPAALRTIEAEGFAGSAARRIVVPETCATIGARAFADCAQLVEIDFLNDAVSIPENAFGGRTDFTIRANPDSAAARFAQSHGIRWTAIDE